jgi:hypothetical protein
LKSLVNPRVSITGRTSIWIGKPDTLAYAPGYA